MTLPEPESPIFTLTSSGVRATAVVRGGQFTVLKGSQVRAGGTAFVAEEDRLLLQRLLEGQQLIANGPVKPMVFQEDVVFKTASSATAVILRNSSLSSSKWVTQLEDGQEQTYGVWRQNSRTQNLPEVGSSGELGSSWKPFFHELSVRLLDYEQRQPELIELLRVVGVKVPHDEGEELSVLDPFSFFSLILKHQSTARATELFRAIGVRLSLSEAAPEDLTGVPWSNPMNAWFFAYRSARRPEDLPTLWALARQAVAGRLEAGTFEQALTIRKVALPKLTAGLFWLNPDAFLPLNSVNVPFLEQRGIRGAARVETLADLERVLEAARLLNPDFAALSHQAWLTVQASKSVAVLNGEAFPFMQFQDEAAQYAADTSKGNMLLDRRYAPLLLSLMDGLDLAQLRPSRSPYSGETHLAVKIGLLGSANGGSAPFARALLLPTQTDIDDQLLPEGLILEAGLSGGHGEEVRDVLKDAFLREELMQALLPLPEELPHVILRLTGDVLGFFPLSLSLDGISRAALQTALDGYLESTGKSRRFQIKVILGPGNLENDTFPVLLESALTYVDRIMDIFVRVNQVTSLPVPLPVVQPPFVPVPGVPLNQVLYGPPGTGKTYRVVDEALSVLDPEFLVTHPGPQGRLARKARYDELAAEERISFVTFHQSFGYEDFIEGIKPVMQQGQLSYRLQDGVFLEAVRSAGGELPRVLDDPQGAVSVTLPHGLRPNGQVWRLYIGGTAQDSEVRDRCLARGEMRIGSWGKTPTDLASLPDDNLTPQQLLFRSGVRVGDLVLLATGIGRIGAVGVVTGDYQFDARSEPIFALDYAHVRGVHWLATELNVSAQEITGRQFSPPTLQRVADLAPVTVLERLQLFGPSETGQPVSPTVRPHVLIIDEINRGNVAKIFGELITLLEGSKRAGTPEALTATLPLSRRRLSVPQSLYVIGTMNTADRSLTLLDSALRRRFAFRPVWPQPEVLPVLEFEDGAALDLRKFLFAVNGRIEQLLSREQVIGHAYLLDLPESPKLSDVALVLKERILPLLEEYFFEDWGKIREVLGDDKKEKDEALQFIRHRTVNGNPQYWVNVEAFESVEAFSLVYSQLDDSVFKFNS